MILPVAKMPVMTTGCLILEGVMKRILAALAVSALAVGAAQAADFAEVDTDADGIVSLDEAVSMMPDLTEDAFISADANADGALTAEEFASMKN